MGLSSRTSARSKPKHRFTHLTNLAAALLASAFACAAFAQTPPEPEVLFANLESALAEAPKANFQVDAALAALGTPGEVSVEFIFDFVRDDIGYLPYRGALKGAAGVLMDGAGNALDRTLLLKALLEANGVRAIVAHATLDAAAAGTAAAALRTRSDGSPDEAQPTDPVEQLAALYGLDPDAVTARLEPAVTAGAALARSIGERTTYQSEAVLAALEASGKQTAFMVEEATSVQEAVSDHWWVEVQGDNGWLDLDPTLPDAQIGTSLAQAQLRFDLTDLRLLAAVDGSCRDLSCGDRLHRVKVAAVAETWDGEALTETEIAATDLLAAEGADHAVVFTALPTDWPDLDLYAEPNAKSAYQGALLATTGWRPTFFVNDTTIGKTTVNNDGSVREDGGGGGAGGLGGGLGGMFGGFGGSTAGADDESTGAFTALWLDYTVTAAGAFETTYRREIFDLLGPAARAAGVTAVELTEAQRMHRAAALLGQTEIVVTGASLPAEALDAAAVSRLLSDKDAWLEAYALGGGPLPPQVINERLAGIARLVTPIERFQQLRGAHMTAVQTAPLVVAYHRNLEPDLSATSAFDLVSGGVSTTDHAGARQAQLVQGVRDTVMEALLQEQLADPSEPTQGPAAVSVAFATDLVAGHPWQVVASTSELDATAPNLVPDLRARVVADLAAGRLALVPVGGEDAVGWWSLDPATGAVVGIGNRGWGQAYTEHTELVNVLLQERTILTQYYNMARCLGLAISLPLQGYSDDSKNAVDECIFTTICAAVNTGLTMGIDINVTWTNVITLATIDALWGGVTEGGYGGFCGALFKKLKEG